MAAELRRRKCQFVFETYWDYNKDGCIDKKDIDLQIIKCCEVKGYKQGSPEYEKIKTTLYKILDGMMQQLDVNKDGKITLDEWMALYEDYTKNRSEPKEWIKLYGDFVFDVLRSNSGDDSITLEQYTKVLAFFGMNIEDAKNAFKRSSKGRSIITKTEFSELWEQYFTSDDPNAPGNLLCGY